MEGQETQVQESGEVEFVSVEDLRSWAENPAPAPEAPVTPVTEPTPTTPVTQEATPEPQPPVAAEPTQEIQEPQAEPKIEFAPAPPRELTVEEFVSRQQDKDALLKAIGLDDFTIGAWKYYQQTGDMTPYLEAKTVDYTKLTEQSIVERRLREQYAQHGLSNEDLDLLVSDEMATKYKQDPESYSEKEVQLGAIRMKADAAAYRKEFMERQAKFAPPPVQQREPEPPEPTMEEMVAANKQRVLADPAVMQFTKQPILKIGEGEKTFNYQSKNPNVLLNVLADPNAATYYTSKKDELGRIVVDSDNNPVQDFEFLLELAAHMVEGRNYNRYLINHGESLGTKQIAEEINPTPTMSGGVPPAQAPSEMELLAQALRNKGFN